ncbi:unnamed protein product [Oikopleura dioica]|uniref:Peptidase C14 caspase domain-containing protein n=1 Tax=Oikopleura dioica TaxID=34765 RepID=E4WZA3_OIKDI
MSIYPTHGRKCFIGIFPKTFSKPNLANLTQCSDSEYLKESFKSQGWYTKFSKRNEIRKESAVRFLRENVNEFQEGHDVSRVVVYICTHGFSSQYGQHLEFYDGDILLDDLLRPLYQCLTLKGVPLLIILHSCRRFREINDDHTYRYSPHNSHDGERIAHAKLDVGFIFSVDENRDAIVEHGESNFAKRLAEAFQNDNDIFRATSKLGLRHSFRVRFDGDSRNDEFYDDSKRKKACFIVTVGEFDEPENWEEKLQDFHNADIDREEMRKVFSTIDCDVITSRKTRITLASFTRWLKDTIEKFFKPGHSFKSIIFYLKTHGSWGKKGQVVHFSDNKKIALLDLLKPFNEGNLKGMVSQKLLMLLKSAL